MQIKCGEEGGLKDGGIEDGGDVMHWCELERTRASGPWSCDRHYLPPQR